MPSVAIIKLLSEHGKAAPPKPDVVAEWKSQYLEIFDEQIDGLDPKAGFKSERRKMIAGTFADLLKVSKKFWK